MQGKSPLVQVKERYGNLVMVTCRLHPATRSVLCSPADNAKSESQAVYREREKKRKKLVLCGV